MNAAELMSLSQKLTNHAIGYGDYAIAGQLREAAEVLELLAWAEENNVIVDRGEGLWSAWWEGGPQVYAKTFLDTLRRAREASKS